MPWWDFDFETGRWARHFVYLWGSERIIGRLKAMKAELSRAELRYLRTIEGVICEVHQDREPMMFADLADAEHMWVELHRSFGVPFDECECDILHVENEPGDEDGREDETPLADVKNATRCADGKGEAAQVNRFPRCLCVGRIVPQWGKSYS